MHCTVLHGTMLLFRVDICSLGLTASRYCACMNIPMYLPRENGEDSYRPFNARRWLFHVTLTTAVTEVHGDDEQSHQHPDDRNASPENQRLYQNKHQFGLLHSTSDSRKYRFEATSANLCRNSVMVLGPTLLFRVSDLRVSWHYIFFLSDFTFTLTVTMQT